MGKNKVKEGSGIGKWIAIISLIVGIFAVTLTIMNTIHNSEIQSLESKHMAKVENLKAEYIAEKTELKKQQEEKMLELSNTNAELNQRIMKLEDSFNSLDSILEKLRELISDRVKDRLSEMKDILDRNKKANIAVLELLQEYSKEYRESKEKAKIIETHFTNYYQSLNETMTYYEKWHKLIVDLLIDLRKWLWDQKDKIPSLDAAEKKFENAQNIAGWRVSEETLEKWRQDAMRKANKIDAALTRVKVLSTKLEDNNLRITESTP